MSRIDLDLSWTSLNDANLKAWRIYLSDSKLAKGQLRATVSPEDSEATIKDVNEGEVFARVVAVNRAGIEQDWEQAEHVNEVVSKRRHVPSAPSVAAQAASPAMAVSLAVDAPDKDDPPQLIEVVAGPDADRGQSLGTVPVEYGDECASAPVTMPLTPGLAQGETQDLHVQGVSSTGHARGDATTIEVGTFDLPNHVSEAIASIVGDTLINFDAPGATDTWETDATDGVVLRALPIISALTGGAAGWGTLETGLFADHVIGSRYLPEAVITSNEKDLGTTRDFILECWDAAQLKTAAGSFAVDKLRDLGAGMELIPLGIEELRGETRGPRSLMDWITLEGKPVRPIEQWQHKWEYRATTTTPITGDWTRYAPGALVSARYVQVRVTLANPVGWHGLIVPKLYARAWHPILDPTTHTDDPYRVGEVIIKASDFVPADLNDVTGTGQAQIGIVTGATKKLQVNIGGTIYGETLT
jgi:hypothetical protein